jgi:hypothetical protein
MAPIYQTGVAAGTAVVGYNVQTGERWARSPVNRVLLSAAITGSAVIGDTQIDLYIDEVRVSSLFNSALLTPQVDRDMQPLGELLVPAGAELQAIVIDAPATSIVYLAESIEDI